MIDPDDLHRWAKAEYAPCYGAMMAFLRAWYRGKRWKARILEGAMMGVVLLCVVPSLKALGVSPALALAFAGWAGYVGVDALAAFVSRRMGV